MPRRSPRLRCISGSQSYQPTEFRRVHLMRTEIWMKAITDNEKYCGCETTKLRQSVYPLAKPSLYLTPYMNPFKSHINAIHLVEQINFYVYE